MPKQETQMLSEAVLDSSSTYALLTIAREEGLLEIDTRKTDNFLSNSRHPMPPTWLHRQILEQITLTPKIKTFVRLPSKGIKGRLIEEGILETIEPPQNHGAQFETLPFEVINGMLQASGIELPLSEFISRLSETSKALDELEAFTLRTGREPLGLKDFIVAMSEQKRPANCEDYVPDGYTKQDVQQYRKHERIFHLVRPITDRLNEYANLITVSMRDHSLVKTPILGDEIGKIRGDFVNSKNGLTREVGLFRVVATQLGKLTHMPTIDQSLLLANDPASISLRQYIPNWLEALSNTKRSEADFIEREIKKATKVLARVSKMEKASRIIGYFSIPAALIETLLAMLPIPGVAIELLSRGLEGEAKTVAEPYLWLSFGNIYDLPK